MKIDKISTPMSQGTSKTAPASRPTPPATAFPVSSGTQETTRKPIVQIGSRNLLKKPFP